MNKRFLIFGTLVLIAVALCSCANRYFADRTTNPVIEDYINHGPNDAGLGVFSITASRRNAYVQLLHSGEIGLVCAEPPPDVGEAFAKSLAAGVDTGEVSANVASAAATSIAPLLYRSQGLQLYRDAASHLCFMHMNNVIDRSAFAKEERDRFDRASELIKEEMKVLSKMLPASTTAPGIEIVSDGKTVTVKTTAATIKVPETSKDTDAAKKPAQ